MNKQKQYTSMAEKQLYMATWQEILRGSGNRDMVAYYHKHHDINAQFRLSSIYI
jgi:hypothetical protein